MSKVGWGILGTANISRKNWKSILHAGHVVTAVGSRNARRSREFIEQCQKDHPFATAPVALGSYEELIDSPTVDAIYIPIPTGLRKDWVVRAAKAGKHVLSEKPGAATVADLREMIEACQRNRVQFMDGVMFMHNPRLERIRRALDNSTVLGEIKRITSHFSFEASDDFLQANIRSDATLEPLGCLGDLGWYNIRFALWTMNWQLPREVSGRILSQAGRQHGHGQVPFEFSGELIFGHGVSSGFYCSFLTTYSNWAVVTGTKGEVRVPDFALPKNSSEGALETNGALADDLVVDPLTAQETNMIRAFSAQVLSGKLNQDWVDWALKTQIVTNACLEAARTGRPVEVKG